MQNITRITLSFLAVVLLIVVSTAQYSTAHAAWDSSQSSLGADTTPITAWTTCTSSTNKLSSFKFSITHSDGSVVTVSHFGGAVQQGDQITVSFVVKPGCSNVPMSLVAYSAPAPTYDRNTADQQFVSDSQTGSFNAGPNTMTVNVPSCYFQVDFVRGDVITQLGPANTHNFYGDQGRLVDHDNGGTNSCGPQ